MTRVNAKPFISILLASTLWLGGAASASGQSTWPTEKTITTEKKKSVPTTRKAGSRSRRKAASTRRPRIVATPRQQPPSAQEAVLRSMSEVIARQSQALEALTMRLEAAERRLDVAAPVPEAIADDRADLFRAALAVDWAQVIDELGP